MQRLPFPTQRLAGRAAIAIDGPDAGSFLQGLVTADIAALAPGSGAYAALLQPQGKILFEFFILRVGDGFLIDCAADTRQDLLKRLGFYRLRAKLTIAPSDLAIGISYREPEAPLRYPDPRTKLMGWRMFAAAGVLPEGDNSVYRAARIRLGLAGSRDIGSGALFPHEANLDQLNGVSFAKGCYVGQEVVSRMEHRGTARSRILPVHIVPAAPDKGAEIRAGGKSLGTVLCAQGQDGLALIRLDRLKDAREAGGQLLTNGGTVSVIKPAWARFDVAA